MGQPLDSSAVETTWLAVYKYFMEAVDGIDNGEPKMCMHQLNCAHMFVHSVKHRHIVQSSSTRWTAQTTAHACVSGTHLADCCTLLGHGMPMRPLFSLQMLIASFAGVNQYDSDKPARYVSNTNLSSRVGNLNPTWNGDQSEEASHAQFQKAMQLTGHEFTEALEYYSNVRSASSSCLKMALHLRNVFRHYQQLHDIGHASNTRAACLLCVAGCYCTENGFCRSSWHTLWCPCGWL